MSAARQKSTAPPAADVAIRARNLTKIYRLYDRPFDRVKEFLTGGRWKLHREVRGLEDVSFDVPKGSTLGLVGSNGAGKSTLLKVLSGTTLASSGSFEVRGKVASLLELGAGFFPGFSGAQNILLNGIMSGFSRREVLEKQQGIIEFSELGDFIHQPIRTYSSGMVMRLAFSIATAIDPEVLIIDEILAVGDLHFQKRCIDRIVNFKKSGKTILFCSHSMYHVEEICDRTLWIKDGRIHQEGVSREVVRAYENFERGRRASFGTPGVEHGFEETRRRPQLAVADHASMDGEGTDGVDVAASDPAALPRVLDLRLRDPHSEEILSKAQLLKDVVVEIDYEVPHDLPACSIGFGVYRTDQVLVGGVASHLSGFEAPNRRGRWRVQILLPRVHILQGEYNLVAYLADERGLHIYHQRSLDGRLHIEQPTRDMGVMYLDHVFSAEPLRWPTAAERAAEGRSAPAPARPPASP